MAEGLDHITHSQPDGYEEEGEASSRSVFDEVRDEEPRSPHQPERRGYPGQVEHRNQRQVEDCGRMPEQDPEHKEVCGRAGLGRVAVRPRPRPLPPLAHLGEVGVGVVAEEEEAHEHLATGLDGVAVHVGHRGQDRKREAGQDRQPPFAESPARAFGRRRWRPAYRFHRPRLSLSTVHKARRTSPRETLDAPATRSSKWMGTSTTV